MMRLKHFHPNPRGWEEKWTTRSSSRGRVVADGAVHFEGMSFHPRGDHSLTVYLAIQEQRRRRARGGLLV